MVIEIVNEPAFLNDGRQYGVNVLGTASRKQNGRGDLFVGSNEKVVRTPQPNLSGEIRTKP